MLLLARAFDQAWVDYYVPGRSGTLSKDIVRPMLARHLVTLAREGVDDENALAAAGLRHLLSVTPYRQEGDGACASNEEVIDQKLIAAEIDLPSFHSHLDGVHATFLPGYSIPSRRLG